MKRKKQKNKMRAFSLMEVMLSMFILSVALIAIITLISNSVSLSMKNRDRVIATQLAQEGVELAINRRDTLKLRGENYDFVNIFNGGVGVDRIEINVNTRRGRGTIDYNDIDEFVSQEGSGSPLCFTRYANLTGCSYIIKYDGGVGYQYDSGLDTKFSREIRFWYAGNPINNANDDFSELDTCSGNVASFVCWLDSSATGGNRCVSAQTSFEMEKDPNNPKCRKLNDPPNIPAGEVSFIDYT